MVCFAEKEPFTFLLVGTKFCFVCTFCLKHKWNPLMMKTLLTCSLTSFFESFNVADSFSFFPIWRREQKDNSFKNTTWPCHQMVDVYNFGCNPEKSGKNTLHWLQHHKVQVVPKYKNTNIKCNFLKIILETNSIIS